MGMTVPEPAPESSSTGPSKFNHIPGLDGFRAISVIVVMLYHANIPFMRGGYLGVEIFFVISGFLITGILLHEARLNEGRIRLITFWKRRALRLLPALFALLFFITLYGAIVLKEEASQFRFDILASLFYFENWYQIYSGNSYLADNGLPLLKHIWSLAVEEQFYLAWPFLTAGLLYLSKGRTRVLFTVALVFITASFSAMFFFSLPAGQTDSLLAENLNRAYLGTDTRAFGILSGALLAIALTNSGFGRLATRFPEMFSILAFTGLIALCSILDIQNLYLYRGGFLLVDLLTLIILAALVKRENGVMGQFLGTGLLEWIGKRSYGIYLWHWPVFKLTGAGNGEPVWTVLSFILTFILAGISYRWLETPIRLGGFSSLTFVHLKIRKTVAVTASVFGILVLVWSGMLLAHNKPYKDPVQESLALNSAAIDTAPESVTPAPPPPMETVPASTEETDPIPPEDKHEQATILKEDDLSYSGNIEEIKVTAIGDSVMKGAAIALKQQAEKNIGKNAIAINAEESRSFGLAYSIVSKYRQNNLLGDVVIIHLGTNNSSISKKEFGNLMKLLSDRKLILFLTARSDKIKICENVNATLAKFVSDFPNARILDWKAVSEDHPELFHTDRTHLKPSGARFYAAAVFRHIAQHLEKPEPDDKQHLAKSTMEDTE